MNRTIITDTQHHIFALYVSNLSQLIKPLSGTMPLTVTDTDIVHRISTVLRLEVDDACILFDRFIHAHVIIKKTIKKKSLECVIIKTQKNYQQKPHTLFLLPMLKKNNLETAIYTLTEIGVSTIQLLYTQKTARTPFTQKDKDRIERIMITAAEQSKNFSYPDIKEPIFLGDACLLYTESPKIVFDPEGKPVGTIIDSLQDTNCDRISLIIGPEGDFTHDEKSLLQSHGFIRCALTSTVLRSVQAVSLGAGIIHSLLRK